jgi:GntR family transcriptional regulator / MocR family aminotransferase
VTRVATPVNFSLNLAEAAGPRASQVSRALIEAMADGQISDGDRLPSTRTLALTFGLARSAVVSAYEELIAAGFLVARPGGHTFVEHGARAAALAGALGASLPPPAARQPGRASRIAYDLRPGLADTELISVRDWTRSMRLAAQPARTGDTGDPMPPSHEDLRRLLSGHLRRARALAADPADVFLFPSVTAALAAVAVVCDLTGGQVAFEDPGYTKARLALGGVGTRIRAVAVDEDGIRAQDLRTADRGVYVTPAHQFPLGGRMPAHRRADLLAWAESSGALVLEDDYDGEFRYGVPPLTPLRSMPAGSGRVVYFGTSAKVLSPALRLSWAIVPTRYRDGMRQHLQRSGESFSGVSAALLAAYISTGALTRHQARAMRTYSARQARFVAACREMIPGVRPLGIEAGLHVVLTFRTRIDDVAAAERLAGSGLACTPLSAYYAEPLSAGRTGLVCGYSRLTETSARAAATVIARAVTGLT